MAELPAHLSHSQMQSFLHCGKSYQLKRLQGAPSLPSVWLVAGTALHDAIDTVNRAFHADVPVDLIATWEQAWNKKVDEFTAKYPDIPLDSWRKAGRASADKPNKEDFAWWKRDGQRQLIEYSGWLRNSGWTIASHPETGAPLSEFETTAEFGGLMVKGFLDAVLQRGQDIAVVDYKSGTRVPLSTTQLGLYAQALQRTIGLKVTEGAYYMTRKAELTDRFPLHRYTGEWFDLQFSRLRKAMEADIFIPQPGEACFMCDVKDACYAVGGHDAWRFDPDHPQFTPIEETA